VIGPGKTLFFTAPIDKFFLYFKVGIFTGFILASPVIIWQAWTFIAPGLHRNERRFALGFVGSAVALFAMGIAFAFFAMPIALRFLIGIGTADIQYLPIANSYINFVLILIAIFGVTFELPLAMTMLGLAGIVSAKFLSRNRFKFWLGIFTGANMVTPGIDPFTPTLLTLPLIILFEASILVIRALRR
jgi:sec-independent protein translocase protein TatC